MRKILYFLLSFSIAILLLSFFYPRIGLSYHGNFHYSIVFQILNGYIPPDNICLAGFPSNYPWIYHLILANTHKLLGLNLINLNQILNLLLFVGFFILIYKANKKLFKKDIPTLLSTILSAFGLNLFAGLFFIVKYPWKTGFFINEPDTLFKYLTPVSDTRYANIFNKFLNVSGYPFGLFLIALYFFSITTLLINTKLNLRKTLMSLTTLLVVLFVHPFSALFILTILFPAFFLATFLKKKLKKDLLVFAIMHFFVLIVALPYLISISGGVSTFVFDPIKRDLVDILISYPVHFLLLFFIATKIFKKVKLTLKSLDSRELFFSFGILFVVLTVFLFEFVGGNDYKFVQLLSLLISPLLVLELKKHFKKKYLKKVYYSVSFLILVKLVLIAFAYFNSQWASESWEDKIPTFYQQLEAETNIKDIIIYKNDDFYNLKGSYLAKRRNYVVECPLHTDYYNALEQRLYLINNLSTENIRLVKSEFPESSIVIISETELEGFEKMQIEEGDKNIYIVD